VYLDRSVAFLIKIPVMPSIVARLFMHLSHVGEKWQYNQTVLSAVNTSRKPFI
jgi:hypothetical protein